MHKSKDNCVSEKTAAAAAQQWAFLLKFGETQSGFYGTQYPASNMHKSLGMTRQFTLPVSTGMQTCLLCLSLKSNNSEYFFCHYSGFPIITGYL